MNTTLWVLGTLVWFCGWVLTCFVAGCLEAEEEGEYWHASAWFSLLVWPAVLPFFAHCLGFSLRRRRVAPEGT
jgi:hypothetical protein